jgi:hypothetical protein
LGVVTPNWQLLFEMAAGGSCRFKWRWCFFWQSFWETNIFAKWKKIKFVSPVSYDLALLNRTQSTKQKIQKLDNTHRPKPIRKGQRPVVGRPPHPRESGQLRRYSHHKPTDNRPPVSRTNYPQFHTPCSRAISRAGTLGSGRDGDRRHRPQPPRGGAQDMAQEPPPRARRSDLFLLRLCYALISRHFFIKNLGRWCLFASIRGSSRSRRRCRMGPSTSWSGSASCLGRKG